MPFNFYKIYLDLVTIKEATLKIRKILLRLLIIDITYNLILVIYVVK